jgi:hypothetical protein
VLGGDQHPEAAGIEVRHRAQVDNHCLEAGLQQLIDQQVELLGARQIDRSGEDDPRQGLLNLGLDREACLGILCQWAPDFPAPPSLDRRLFELLEPTRSFVPQLGDVCATPKRRNGSPSRSRRGFRPT